MKEDKKKNKKKIRKLNHKKQKKKKKKKMIKKILKKKMKVINFNKVILCQINKKVQIKKNILGDKWI